MHITDRVLHKWYLYYMVCSAGLHDWKWKELFIQFNFNQILQSSISMAYLKFKQRQNSSLYIYTLLLLSQEKNK